MPQNPIPAVIGQQFGTTSYVAAQFGKQRELWTSDKNGKYYLGTYAGTAGFIANQAAVTLTALAATTYTGLAIQNPTGSGVNLAIQEIQGVSAVLSAAVMQSVGFVGGSGVYTPADSLTPYSSKLGASNSKLLAVPTASATVATTQVLVIPCANTQIASGAYAFHIDVNGEFIVPPGEWAGFVQLTGAGTAVTFWGAISWQEVPV